MWGAAAEFGLPSSSSDPTDGGVGGGAPSSAPGQVISRIGGRFYQHPGFVLGVVIFATAGLAAYASKPLAKGSIKGELGPVKASAEGEV